MGLDNGIALRMKEGFDVPSLLNYNVYDGNIEVCYWRKCWGIREAILNVLDPKGILQKKPEYKFNVDAEDIPALIKALKQFFSKEYWDENAESIWEFDEQFDSLINQVLNLRILYEFLKEHKDEVEEIYFYDSY